MQDWLKAKMLMLGCDTVIEARVKSLSRSSEQDIFKLSYRGQTFSQPSLTRESSIEAELILDDSAEEYSASIYENFLYVSDGQKIFAKAWLKRYQVEYGEGMQPRITATAEFTDMIHPFDVTKTGHVYLLGKDLEIKLEET